MARSRPSSVSNKLKETPRKKMREKQRTALKTQERQVIRETPKPKSNKGKKRVSFEEPNSTTDEETWVKAASGGKEFTGGRSGKEVTSTVGGSSSGGILRSQEKSKRSSNRGTGHSSKSSKRWRGTHKEIEESPQPSTPTSATTTTSSSPVPFTPTPPRKHKITPKAQPPRPAKIHKHRKVKSKSKSKSKSRPKKVRAKADGILNNLVSALSQTTTHIFGALTGQITSSTATSLEDLQALSLTPSGEQYSAVVSSLRGSLFPNKHPRGAIVPTVVFKKFQQDCQRWNSELDRLMNRYSDVQREIQGLSRKLGVSGVSGEMDFPPQSDGEEEEVGNLETWGDVVSEEDFAVASAKVKEVGKVWVGKMERLEKQISQQEAQQNYIMMQAL